MNRHTPIPFATNVIQWKKNDEGERFAMFSKLSPRVKELLRFAITGGVCFLIDYGVMVLLKEVFHLHYLLAAGAGFTVSVIANYIICVKWVFDGAKQSGAQTKALFLITSLVGLGLTEVFMLAMVSWLALHYMLAKVLTTLLVMVWNYITKKWALTKRKNA